MTKTKLLATKIFKNKYEVCENGQLKGFVERDDDSSCWHYRNLKNTAIASSRYVHDIFSKHGIGEAN
jgi:hypothetical protein